MTRPLIFDPPNRLSRVLVETGGSTRADAVQRAEAKVAELGPQLRRVLDHDVSLLVAMQRLAPDAKRAESAALGDTALRIAEVAAAVGSAETGEVARGLYAMVVAYKTEGLWRADALDLHLSAIALFEGPEPLAPQAADTLLRRLAQMRAAIGVQE